MLPSRYAIVLMPDALRIMAAARAWGMQGVSYKCKHCLRTQPRGKADAHHLMRSDVLHVRLDLSFVIAELIAQSAQPRRDVRLGGILPKSAACHEPLVALKNGACSIWHAASRTRAEGQIIHAGAVAGQVATELSNTVTEPASTTSFANAWVAVAHRLCTSVMLELPRKQRRGCLRSAAKLVA